MMVLDASALLAFLYQEPGAERVGDQLAQSCMSTVNLSEVLGRFARDGHDTSIVLDKLMSSPIQFLPFGESEANEAASLMPATITFGLSLGDRACLALARLRGVPVLTADRVWESLQIGVRVELIR